MNFLVVGAHLHIECVGIIDRHPLECLAIGGLNLDPCGACSSTPGWRTKSAQISHQLTRVGFVEVEGRHSSTWKAVAQHSRQLLIVERSQPREDTGPVLPTVG